MVVLGGGLFLMSEAPLHKLHIVATAVIDFWHVVLMQLSTLEVTQRQILSRSPTDVTSWR